MIYLTRAGLASEGGNFVVQNFIVIQVYSV